MGRMHTERSKPCMNNLISAWMVITGVSIGAINAAVLVGAKNDPISVLDELWRKRLTIKNWSFASSTFERYPCHQAELIARESYGKLNSFLMLTGEGAR